MVRDKLLSHITLISFITVIILFLSCGLFNNYENRLQKIQSGEEPLNIILISIDTLRADHLSPYGHKIETPNIQRLADDGTTFLHCEAPTPMTLPSHASMFTGIYPIRHGVHNNGQVLLDEGIIFLGEILQQNGYITSGFIAVDIIGRMFGFNQGFDYFGDEMTEKVGAGFSRIAEEVLKDIQKHLKIGKTDKYFTFIHFYDPHHPYIPPTPFKSEYEENPYDGEIAYTDEVIGELLEWFDEKDLLENTLIILTSDHGEEFMEHGLNDHGVFIYETTQHVPLIFWCPGLIPDGVKIEEQVRLIDIVPTVLDILGIENPVEMDGVSLVDALIRGKKMSSLPNYCESYFSSATFGWSNLLGMNDGEWKYILAPKPELYNLKEDPGETENLYNEHPDIVSRLDTLLVDTINECRSKSMVEADFGILSDEVKSELETLGYFAHGGAIVEGGENVDPKDKIEFIRKFRKVNDGKTNYEDRMNELIEMEPDLPINYIMLADYHIRYKEFDKALNYCEKVIELNPKEYQYKFKLADTYIKLGNFISAEKLLDEVIENSESNRDLSLAYFLKGIIESEYYKNYEESLKCYETSLGLNKNNSEVYYYAAILAFFNLDNNELAKKYGELFLEHAPSYGSAVENREKIKKLLRKL